MSDGLKLLREPFSENQINQLPKPYKSDSAKGKCNVCGGLHGLPAAHLDYVGHAALTARLLDADPEWSWEPMAVDQNGMPVLDANGGLWIKLTVCGVTRPGYGDAQGKKGGNAVKEAIGDALRNAGMRFGAALDLWHKGDLYEVAEARGEAEPAPVVDAAREAAIAEWIAVYSKAETVDQLQAAWEGSGKKGLNTDQRIVRAKDDRKKALA